MPHAPAFSRLSARARLGLFAGGVALGVTVGALSLGAPQSRPPAWQTPAARPLSPVTTPAPGAAAAAGDLVVTGPGLDVDVAPVASRCTASAGGSSCSFATGPAATIAVGFRSGQLGFSVVGSSPPLSVSAAATGRAVSATASGVDLHDAPRGDYSVTVAAPGAAWRLVLAVS